MKRKLILSLVTALLITQTAAITAFADPVDEITEICAEDECAGTVSDENVDVLNEITMDVNTDEPEAIADDLDVQTTVEEVQEETDTDAMADALDPLMADEAVDNADGANSGKRSLIPANVERAESIKDGIKLIIDNIGVAMSFSVHRSTDGKNFKLIGCCGGNGGGAKICEWEPVIPTYVDKDVVDGTKYWYKIKYCTDWGQASEFGKTTEVTYHKDNIVKPTKVKLSKNKLTATAGDWAVLEVTVLPANAVSDYKLTSSNKKVVEVTKTGEVYFKKAGKATITAKTWNGKTATCKVTINKPVRVKEIKLNKTEAKVKVGKRIMLHAEVLPLDAFDKGVFWDVDNENVHMENVYTDITEAFYGSNNDKGYAIHENTQDIYIIGDKPGTATVTAETYDGEKIATCKITVTATPAESITLNKSKATLKKGEALKLKATLKPKGATKKIKWTSSNSKVAKVSSNGKVTALKKGTATITATTKYGKKKAKCKITVK